MKILITNDIEFLNIFGQYRKFGIELAKLDKPDLSAKIKFPELVAAQRNSLISVTDEMKEEMIAYIKRIEVTDG